MRGLALALIAPVVVLLTVLIWVTLPLWLIGAAALSPLLPGRWRALRLLWVLILYLTSRRCCCSCCSGSGSLRLRRRVRTPYFEGIHYDLVQGVMWVFFREARRVLALEIETDGPTPGRAPRRADPGLLPARRARATRSR